MEESKNEVTAAVRWGELTREQRQQKIVDMFQTEDALYNGVDPIRYAQAGKEMRDFQNIFFAKSRKGGWKTDKEKSDAVAMAKKLEAAFDEMTKQILGLNTLPTHIQTPMF